MNKMPPIKIAAMAFAVFCSSILALASSQAQEASRYELGAQIQAQQK